MSIELPLLPQAVDMAAFRQSIRRARHDRENEVAAKRRIYNAAPVDMRWKTAVRTTADLWPIALLVLGGLLIVALGWGAGR